MTTPRPDPGRPDDAIVRFDATERAVHWATAALFVVLMVTGAILYAGPLQTLVGRRAWVRDVHTVTGFVLPVPLVLALLTRAGAALRSDAHVLARWDPDDAAWWSRSRRRQARLGKFNPGQKLFAAFVAATVVVMLGTGSIMHWFEPFPDDIRTGATFVHDWFAIGAWLSATGHVLLALSDPVALGAMVRGTVPTAWARRSRPRWYDEQAGHENASGTPRAPR